MAVIVVGITGVGVLMAMLGWAIPQLRAIPSLQPDDERKHVESVITSIYTCMHNA